MKPSAQVFHAGINVSKEELLVIGVVILILIAFEMGPKLLNYLKNRRSKS